MCENKTFVLHLCDLWKWSEFENIFSSVMFTLYMGERCNRDPLHCVVIFIPQNSVIFISLIVSCCYWASWFKWLHFWVGFRNCWVQISAGADYLGLVFLLFSLVFASKCSDDTFKQARTVSFHVHSVSCKCMKWERVFCSQLILLSPIWMIDFKLNELESLGSLKQSQSPRLKFCCLRVVHLSCVGTSWLRTVI
jgi:hypothetical protein